MRKNSWRTPVTIDLSDTDIPDEVLRKYDYTSVNVVLFFYYQEACPEVGLMHPYFEDDGWDFDKPYPPEIADAVEGYLESIDRVATYGDLAMEQMEHYYDSLEEI